MQEQQLIRRLIELHQGLSRLGPGSEASTREAFSLCRTLPEAADILDVGCGSGAQTRTLAALNPGRIVAVDLFDDFLAALASRVRQQQLQNRVSMVQADMQMLPFAKASFDLIWSEGAVYLMGFDRALQNWRSLLRPGGFLAITELSWFGDKKPAELQVFWAENYPGMRDEAQNSAAACALGWESVGGFRLPWSDWADGYYRPLRRRLAEFRKRHVGNEDALTVADATEREMTLMERYAADCGYRFYVLRSGAAT